MKLRLPSFGLRWYFDHNDGRLMDKWLHYFPIYERHLEPFRKQRVRMLEIGVSHGGSLQMWQYYFGRGSTIVGIDIDERASELAEDGIIIEIGDQSDASFLRGVVERHGPFDFILDDGSHQPAHQIASIEALWPSLNDGGVYIVEDVHANYWADYGGGRGRTDTFMAWLAHRLDDMHAYHSREPDFIVTDWTTSLAGVHVYDSVAVLDKAVLSRPESRMTGRPSFDELYDRDVETMISDSHREQLAQLGAPGARVRRLLRDPAGTLRRLRTRFNAE